MSILTQLPKRLPATFTALVDLMPPHAIEDEADYQVISPIVDRLAVLAHRTPGQEKYLETWAQLIEAYDARHPIDTSTLTGLDILKSLLNDHQMSASDLGRLLGNRALGGKILRRERELSKSHIKILANHFKLESGIFLK
ncbi:MAG TPA: hypothetical protein VFE58_00345 [Tepidisphaeraceae bacterium]|jgi:HTH-type transcriptional regulator/antitoxin HigA|nr:hypothetical protein [Tepidisphaeraceae bacterium]